MHFLDLSSGLGLGILGCQETKDGHFPAFLEGFALLLPNIFFKCYYCYCYYLLLLLPFTVLLLPLFVPLRLLFSSFSILHPLSFPFSIPFKHLLFSFLNIFSCFDSSVLVICLFSISILKKNKFGPSQTLQLITVFFRNPCFETSEKLAIFSLPFLLRF